jgi:hypothetical protein
MIGPPAKRGDFDTENHSDDLTAGNKKRRLHERLIGKHLGREGPFAPLLLVTYV